MNSTVGCPEGTLEVSISPRESLLQLKPGPGPLMLLLFYVPCPQITAGQNIMLQVPKDSHYW